MTDEEIRAIDEAVSAGWKPRGWMEFYWSFGEAEALECEDALLVPKEPGRW